MTSGRTSKLIRALEDNVRRYWNAVDYEADCDRVSPLIFQMIRFKNNMLVMQLIGRKVDPERWRRYAFWYPIEQEES